MTTPPVSAEQLEHMSSDGVRRELVDGMLREVAPAGFDHGQVALTIGALLHTHVRRQQLGVVVAAETGFRLARNPDTVRAPDVAFVAAHRLPSREARRRFLDLAPDLAVEVVGPSDRAGDVVDKALGWLAAGVRVVWVVYPEQEVVAVYRPDNSVLHLRSGDHLDEDVLPGLRLPVADVFV